MPPAIILVGCVAVLVVWLGRVEGRAKPAPPTATQQDIRDFALVDSTGNAVTLATYRGKWLLLFFGYTNCPDICPATLSNIAATLSELGDRAKDVQVGFVTVDPARDTPPVLADYVANFGPAVVGLTGCDAQIAAAAKQYGAYYRRHPTDDGGYFMDHSTAIIAITPKGHFLRVFRPDDAPADFAQELLTLFNESGAGAP